jgi:hypothetical protein
VREFGSEPNKPPSRFPSTSTFVPCWGSLVRLHWSGVPCRAISDPVPWVVVNMPRHESLLWRAECDGQWAFLMQISPYLNHSTAGFLCEIHTGLREHHFRVSHLFGAFLFEKRKAMALHSQLSASPSLRS